jgi:hypothetical protein
MEHPEIERICRRLIEVAKPSKPMVAAVIKPLTVLAPCVRRISPGEPGTQ